MEIKIWLCHPNHISWSWSLGIRLLFWAMGAMFPSFVINYFTYIITQAHQRIKMNIFHKLVNWVSNSIQIKEYKQERMRAIRESLWASQQPTFTSKSQQRTWEQNTYTLLKRNAFPGWQWKAWKWLMQINQQQISFISIVNWTA